MDLDHVAASSATIRPLFREEDAEAGEVDDRTINPPKGTSGDVTDIWTVCAKP
jgi:hypothetical protein